MTAIPEISTPLSLAVILGTLVVTTVASLARRRPAPVRARPPPSLPTDRPLR